MRPGRSGRPPGGSPKVFYAAAGPQAISDRGGPDAETHNLLLPNDLRVAIGASL